MAKAEEALKKVQEAQKSLAKETEEMKNSVDTKDKEKDKKDKEAKKSTKKDFDDDSEDEVEESAKKSKESESKYEEDKKDDSKDKDDEKSESAEVSGKLESKKAPAKDNAAKSVEPAEYLKAITKSLDLVNDLFNSYKELAKSATVHAETTEKSLEKDDNQNGGDCSTAKEKPEDPANKSEEESGKEDKDGNREDESKESESKEEDSKEDEKSQKSVEISGNKVEKSLADITASKDKNDTVDKSIDEEAPESDSGINKDEFLSVVNKSISNVENTHTAIDYSELHKSLESIRDTANESKFISNDLYNKFSNL